MTEPLSSEHRFQVTMTQTVIVHAPDALKARDKALEELWVSKKPYFDVSVRLMWPTDYPEVSK